MQNNSPSGDAVDSPWDLNARITEGLPLMEKIAQEIEPRLATLVRARMA
jgi:hypothetical protein